MSLQCRMSRNNQNSPLLQSAPWYLSIHDRRVQLKCQVSDLAAYLILSTNLAVKCLLTRNSIAFSTIVLYTHICILCLNVWRNSLIGNLKGSSTITREEILVLSKIHFSCTFEAGVILRYLKLSIIFIFEATETCERSHLRFLVMPNTSRLLPDINHAWIPNYWYGSSDL